MKAHRIILPAAQHEAALRGVDRLLLPMREQPETDEVPGVVWFHVGDRTYGGKRVFAEDGCPYKPGDRLALLERWDSYEDGRWFIYTQNHPDAERFVWRPASRMPLRACRCFYRVLAVEPVRPIVLSDADARAHGWDRWPAMMAAWCRQNGDSSAWAWSVKVEKESK